ncbi:hypothetical protein HPP92_029096 [Vanilla planifolia]|uniref:Uncharacterized protein n=1 Tax=Vanilla planifolia TaxID=51239 RepID=A0A835P570_VANPL|nr:hypothetical protein HPP92_029096 [Vanilla planifolia]KAG0445934.1 hypothetical protein HPP92_029085 [Vanilla planifolia]
MSDSMVLTASCNQNWALRPKGPYQLSLSWPARNFRIGASIIYGLRPRVTPCLNHPKVARHSSELVNDS